MANWKKIKKSNLGDIPSEPSANLTKPELAPSDGRKTGRTKPLGLKVSEETFWLLKDLAIQEKCLMTEIFEKALREYAKKKKA